MSDNSVAAIMDYIQQYPDVSTYKLVQNVLASGYEMKDLLEALKHLGISPSVIPGYKEPDPPPPTPFFTKTPVIIICIIIVLVLIIGGGAFLLLGQKPQPKKTAGKMQQTIIEEPTVGPTPTSVPPTLTVAPTVASDSSTIADPLKIFKDTLNAEDYKVTIDNSESSPAYGDKPAGSSHDSTAMYTRHGQLVRVEEKNNIAIYKDSSTYVLHPTDKTYSIVSNSL